LRTFNVSAFAGQTVDLKNTGTGDSSLQTSFVSDDTALTVMTPTQRRETGDRTSRLALR
jgi:hypothetical protein